MQLQPSLAFIHVAPQLTLPTRLPSPCTSPLHISRALRRHDLPHQRRRAVLCVVERRGDTQQSERPTHERELPTGDERAQERTSRVRRSEGSSALLQLHTRVTIRFVQFTRLGAVVDIISSTKSCEEITLEDAPERQAFIYKSDIIQHPHTFRPGDVTYGYVSNFREDGKVDVKLRPFSTTSRIDALNRLKLQAKQKYVVAVAQQMENFGVLALVYPLKVLSGISDAAGKNGESGADDDPAADDTLSRAEKLFHHEGTEGMLYFNDLEAHGRRVYQGDRIFAYIKNIRADGKIDLSVAQWGSAAHLEATEVLREALERSGGFLDLHDRSPPEDIRDQLQLSKASFKKAVGTLLKNGELALEGTRGIRLTKTTAGQTINSDKGRGSEK